MEASGGGATHMAKTNRFELFNYVDYKDEVICFMSCASVAHMKENLIEILESRVE